MKSNRKQRQFIAPIARLATDEILSDMPEAKKLLAASAWADLARHLEGWLLRILQSEFSAKVAIALSSKKSCVKSPETFSLGITASELGLDGFFTFLPGAKQTVDLVVNDWIEAQSLMLSRLQRDRDRLFSILSGSSDQHIKHVTPGLSDPHGSGHTVTIVEFAGGGRVVYKPRSCEGERIWFSALQWMNKEDFRPAFYIPQLISRRNYCWMSFVEHRCCDSKAAVREFYFRWGAQTAVAQLLGCADLHRQNWIASGEQPVLVDAEMVGNAFLPEHRANRAALSGQQLHPLLKTGLLPLSQNDFSGYYRGIAPFDSTSLRGEQKNFWPMYSGKVERPCRYRGQILEGFTAVLSFLRSPRARKRFSKFVVRVSQRKRVRVLKRATANYYRLMEDSLQPQHMQNRGQRLQYLLDRCGRDPLAQMEARSLFRCCVPRFTKNLIPARQKRGTVLSLATMSSSLTILGSRLGPTGKSRSFGHPSFLTRAR